MAMVSVSDTYPRATLHSYTANLHVFCREVAESINVMRLYAQSQKAGDFFFHRFFVVVCRTYFEVAVIC